MIRRGQNEPLAGEYFKMRCSLGIFKSLMTGAGVTFALSLVACADEGASAPVENTSSTSSELEAIAGLPVPAMANSEGQMQSLWRGSVGELWLADAFASCLNNDVDPDFINDDVMTRVRARMDSTLAAFPSPKPASWMHLRTSASYNAKPISMAPASAGLTVKLPEHYVWGHLAGAGAGAAPGVHAALAAAGVNLCMARTLHEQTQLGSLLLAPAADQRFVLAAIRDRAQLAMLHLSDIVSTIASSTTDETAIDTHAKALRTWAASPGSKATLDAWGADLADAVRLHIAASQTLVELLARSSSARDALPSTSPNDLPSADDFRSGSWRQRALAVLFGGDPLTTGTAGVMAPNGNATRTLNRTQWPSQAEWGSATDGLWTSAAVRALVLARQHNVLSLVLASGKTTYTSPADIDVDASATWLYRDIEAALRTTACTAFDADTSTCGTTTAEQVTEPLPLGRSADVRTLAPFRMWTQHQLRPADVADLVGALVDVLPAMNSTRGLPIVGATRLVHLPGRTATSFQFDAGAYFTQRSPLELAALYAGMGRHRIPSNLASSTTNGVRVEPLYSGSAGVLEAGRRLGTVPALTQVRETIGAFADSTIPGVASVLRYKDAILKAIDSAIGSTRVAIRPSERVTGTSVVQPAGTTSGTHVWSVHLTPEKEDFWTEGNFRVIAVARRPEAALWLTDPTSPKAGLPSLDSLAATSSANITSASLSRDTDGSFSAVLELADDATSVLFVQRMIGRRTDYRAISGPITPSVAGTGASSPVDAMYFAPGGSLGIVAAKVSAVRPTDPSKPAFDGFGELYESLPSRTAEIANADTTPLTAYAERLMATAQSTEQLAQAQLRTVLERIQLDTMEEANVAAAQGRELGQLRVGLTRLCGGAANTAGSLDDLEARSAESACGVTTTTIDAYASTQQELLQACGLIGAGGAPATRPALNWMTSAQCPANPNAPNVTTEQRARCMLDGLAGAVSYRVPLATPVACNRYRSGFVSFAPVGGVLLERMQRQRGALQAYGDAVRELEAAGRMVAAHAKKADEAVILAQAQIDAAKSRAENARRAGLNELASLTEKVAEAQLSVNNISKRLAELTGETWTAYAKGGAVAFSGAAGAVGAANTIGTILAVSALTGGWGIAVGAAVGGAVALVSWLANNEEEIDAAKRALSEAKLRLQHAQEEEARYAAFVGVCLADPNSTGDDRYGDCPAGDPNMFGTVIDVYSRETAVAEQQKALALSDAAVALHQATLTMAEKLSRVSAAQSTLALESSGLQIDLGQAQSALAEAKLEVVAAQTRANAEYGLSKAFHASDMWAVQGLLDLARRDILAARRATEFATMSDMSTLTSSGLSVGAPWLWADQVYDYDLSPLRVSGTREGRFSTTTVNETKLSLYLAHLRSAASSIHNAQHVTYSPSMPDLTVLPGPAATMTMRVNGSAGSEDISVRDPVATMWQVNCPAPSDCAPNGGWCSAASGVSFEDVCTSTDPNGTVTIHKPTSIKLPFTLDPWGKLRNTMPVDVLPSLLNGRWSRFAVNVRGADIRDCSASTAPPNCRDYSNSVYFTLRRTGPSYAMGPSYELTLLPLPPVAVTGIARAKGKAFDVLVDDLESSAMRALRRSEFWGYPLGGGYELELYPSAGQEMAKVEAVEILFNATFWQPTGQ